MPFTHIAKTIRTLYRVLIVFIPLLFLALPAHYFDVGQSICLSKALLNIECWGCGMTRAVQHLIHFDFQIAWNYNKLSFIVLPLLMLLYVKEVRTSYLYFKESLNTSR